MVRYDSALIEIELTGIKIGSRSYELRDGAKFIDGRDGKKIRTGKNAMNYNAIMVLAPEKSCAKDQ